MNPPKALTRLGLSPECLYDGNDPAFEDFYLPNQAAPNALTEWYTSDPKWHAKWYAFVKDVIDQYQPELLYSDGGVPFGEYGLNIISHLYNRSAGRHGGANQAVYTQKDRNESVYTVGVLDIERSQLARDSPARLANGYQRGRLVLQCARCL